MLIPPAARLLVACMVAYGTAPQAFAQAASSPAGQEPGAAFASPVRIFGGLGGVTLEWAASARAPVEYYAVYRLDGTRERVVATFTPRAAANSEVTYRYIDQGGFPEGSSFRVTAVYADGRTAGTDATEIVSLYDARDRPGDALDGHTLARLYDRPAAIAPAEAEPLARN